MSTRVSTAETSVRIAPTRKISFRPVTNAVRTAWIAAGRAWAGSEARATRGAAALGDVDASRCAAGG